MALSLSAEQKSILEIYQGEEIFVIPGYQRPYSWGYDECYALYSDLMSAFKDDCREYFIGNLVIARYKSPKYERQVVDGQQRLTTLWLMLKVLNILCETVNPLRKTLSVDAREGNTAVVKVQPFMTQDREIMNAILKMSLKDFEIPENSNLLSGFNKANEIIVNLFYFYEWFNYYSEKSGMVALKDFANYLLDNVYLLPIELYDEKKDIAQNKALTIFETINNRGLDLTNADIFKSKLYEKALFVHEQARFVSQWIQFNEACVDSGLFVDDVFRYYSHIIRGRNNMTQMEMNLRDFFITESSSPLVNGSYASVMNDLMHILDIISFIQHEMQKPHSDIGKWFQVVDAFSNNYPKTALLVYLYVYGYDDTPSIISFTKKLIRYSYYFGSSRSVKFGIYSIIASVANKRQIDEYLVDWPLDYDYSTSGRIKEGFVKIAYYYDHPNMPNASIDRWITNRDMGLFSTQLTKEDSNIFDSIGNYVMLDVGRISRDYYSRCNAYSKSSNQEVKELFDGRLFFVYGDLKKRDDTLRENIQKFMKGS